MIRSLFALFLLASSAQAMTFENHCMGNAIESCFIIAEGEITPDDVATFAAHDFSDMVNIALNSPGGSLTAGLDLGRIIREKGLTTWIGTKASVLNGDYPPLGGECASACAYTFAGGIRRHLQTDNQLGFHRFFVQGEIGISGAQGIDAGQELATKVIAYLVEMGIDPRIFVVGFEKTAGEMLYLTPEQAIEYDLISATGYGPFFLEPYGAGVIAAAKRQEIERSPYDLIGQTTAYCRKGKAYLLFSSDVMVPDRSVPFGIVVNERDPTQIDAAKVKPRLSKDKGGVIEVQIPSQTAAALTTAQTIGTWFEYSRAEGGDYGTYFTLSDMDRAMLAAAFKFCI